MGAIKGGGVKGGGEGEGCMIPVTAAVTCNSLIELGYDETNQSTREISWNTLCSMVSVYCGHSIFVKIES